MNPLKRVVAVVLATWALPGVSADAPKLTSGQHEVKVAAAGCEWSVSIYVPKSCDPAEPSPIVLILHGAGGNGSHYLDRAGWARKADQAGFIAVAPDGLPARPSIAANFVTNPRLWNSGQLAPRLPRARIDDLEFFRQLLDELERLVNVDRKRIYLTGHSNGAGMTFRLGAEMANRWAAIAPVASHCWVNRPAPKRPLPTLYIIGTADPLVPFRGGESELPWGGKRYTPPVEDSLKKWARAIGCPDVARPVVETNGVRVVEYGPGATGGVLRACFIEGHGHNWPGGQPVLPARLVGKSLSVFDATEVIWEFFRTNREF